MNNVYLCIKTYTNGKNYIVKETIFYLTVIKDNKLNKYRVANITNNTIWDNVFDDKSSAIEAIKSGNWMIAREYKNIIKNYKENIDE